MLTEEQLFQLWSFARKDAGEAFESWLYSQEGLEKALGEDFHFRLISCDFKDRDAVWKMQDELADKLDTHRQCECPKIRNLDMVEMGGDFWFEKIFNHLERTLVFGEDKWWLYISTCKTCATIWMIAQEERMYDDFYFKRISERELRSAQSGNWPADFLTYEKVMAIGRKLSNPCSFADPMAHSLQFTVDDLLKERPEITNAEMADLLGLSSEHVEALVQKIRTKGVTPIND